MRTLMLIAMLLAAACSGPADPLAEQAVEQSAEPARTISWENLLPEGEQEKIDQLFATYFEDLELKLLMQKSNQPQSLFDAAKEGGYASVPEGSALDFMPQLGTFDVVEALDGARVRIPGYVLPFEFSESGKISEFLLVPYFGACIHTPPPPPNQIVYVKAKTPIALSDQWEAIWAVGVLRAKSNMNDLGNAAYTLEIETWETFDE